MTSRDERRAHARQVVGILALASVAVLGVAIGLGSIASIAPSAIEGSWSDPGGVVDPAGIDPCRLLARAIIRAGYREGSRARSEHEPAAWGARICVNDDWDGGWEDRHLVFRTRVTSRAEAVNLLASVDVLPDTRRGPALPSWTQEQVGAWVTENAIAVSAEPYFYIITDRDLAAARAVAEAALVELTIAR